METYTVKVRTNGTRAWFQNGKRHRLDGPAIEFTDGNRSWWQNDKLHRLDGPAVEFADGYREWYQKGQLHRTDGPAIERTNGDCEWWINGKQFTEEEFNQQTKKSTCENKTVIIDGIKYKLIKE